MVFWLDREGIMNKNGVVTRVLTSVVSGTAGCLLSLALAVTMGCGRQDTGASASQSATAPAPPSSTDLTTSVAGGGATMPETSGSASAAAPPAASDVSTGGGSSPARLDIPDLQVAPDPHLPVDQSAMASDRSAANPDPIVGAASEGAAVASHSPPPDTTPPATEATGTTDVRPLETPDHLDREPLFVGWPQPKVALMVTGRQFGFMEPCGCSGLDNQNGGLVRRRTLLQQLVERGWPVVPIDAGNQVRRFGRQAEIKFQITIEGLRNKMGYQAIAFGPDDLKLPATELVAVVAPSGSEPSPFVCANVTIYDPSFTSPYLIVEKGGKRIGITAILGERHQREVNNSDITMRGAAEGLAAVWPALRAERCDLYVLIAHASIDESVALGQQFPQFSLVVTAGGAGEPTREPDPIEGTKSQLIQVGTKGMYAGVIGVFDDPTTPLRYQRIPLDSRFADSEEMLQLLAAYQEQLKAVGFEGLGIRPQPHPSGRTFVGSAECRTCHGKEYRIWKDGQNDHAGYHAHAYDTLLNPPERGNIPRNFDPECLSCHVVGWNPQRYFPYESGFLSMEQTPHLINVGCENCHGPGSAHVAAESGDLDLEESEIEELRRQMVLPLSEAEQTCLQCHDLDNSPGFQEKGAFERYWEKIKH